MPIQPASLMRRARIPIYRQKLRRWYENVIAQLSNLQTHPSVRLALEEGRIALHGWVYDIESGSIAAFDGATRQFVPLAANPRVCAIPLRQPTAA